MTSNSLILVNLTNSLWSLAIQPENSQGKFFLVFYLNHLIIKIFAHRDCALHMYVRGTPFESYDGGEHAPPDVAVVDAPLTPSDAGPIEFSFEPKVLIIIIVLRVYDSKNYYSSGENILSLL